MKRKKIIGFLLICISVLISCNSNQQNFNNAFTFIAAADMRFYATEKYRTSQHFLGAVEAIKRVGAGAFMISPGDIDPPRAVREVIDQVLGKDYLWYPTAGNHELEAAEYMDWLRKYNRGGTTLPNIIRKGPPGCEETTYSFDYGSCHFVALNQYYDGGSDTGTDGDIIPELLEWLEMDLTLNTKKHIFVYGHEPIISLPDMDNGRVRHQGDSLDKYGENAFAFLQLLLRYHVTAYICGHTHSTSFGNINGLWQIDVGHSRGIEENSAPEILIKEISEVVEKNADQGIGEEEAIREFYQINKKQVNKALHHMRLAPGDTYEEIQFGPGLQGLYTFYFDYKKGGTLREKHVRTFWENSMYRKSSFVKFYVKDDGVKVEFYRDDAHGGAYSLRQTLIVE